MRCVTRRSTRLALLVGIAAVPLAGGTALASPTYSLLTTIAVPPSPDNSAGGTFAAFDISSFDPATQLDYVADRSNAAVDIFSAATNTYVGRIGGSGGLFSGQTSSNDTSGPDGVVAINTSGLHAVYAGNGDSTLKAFSLPSNAQVANIATGPASANRVDEMAFNPNTRQILAANNSAVPSAFASLIDTATNTVVRKITFDGTNGTPNATGGIEQPAYDAATNKFYVSIPQINGTGAGGVAELDPAGNVTHVYDLSALGVRACSPSGLAASSGGSLVVGCGAPTQTIILDPTANGHNGALTLIPQVSGEDQVAYDPSNGLFFTASFLNPGGPVLGVIDAATDTWLQNVPTTPIDHGVAVDPTSGEVFVPFASGAGNAICPNGCIGVYAANAASVPEPSSLALLAGGMIGLAGFAVRRHRAL